MAIHAPTAEAMAAAAAALHRGELVAFPTETVYGLGANALDPVAVARIFAAKARPAWNPVIVHVASPAEAQALTTQWPRRAERLAEQCWPGPLTLVLTRAAHVPAVVAAGQGTVAVRVPRHPVALALLRHTGLPLAAPSANRFMAVSPTTAQHVVDSLGARVSMVLDGGACEVGIESTVLDLTREPPRLLRYGGVSAETLSELLGERVEPVPAAPHSALSGAPASPGMAARHYAPRAETWLVGETELQDALAALAALIARVNAAGGATGGATPPATLRVGALSWRDPSPLAAQLRAVVSGGGAEAVYHTLAADAAEYARALYAALRACDSEGCTHLLIEAPPPLAEWDAVRDRLQRASHPPELS